VTQAAQLQHEEETDVFADAGDQGVDMRKEAQGSTVEWHTAMRPGKRASVGLSSALAAKIEQVECLPSAKGPSKGANIPRMRAGTVRNQADPAHGQHWLASIISLLRSCIPLLGMLLTLDLSPP
jgi:hypothetical protein